MGALRELAKAYSGIGLERPETRYNIAKQCHDALEAALGQGRRTFFDKANGAGKQADMKLAEDKKEEDSGVAQGPIWTKLDAENGGPDVRLSSLDFTVYAYLKEELVNSIDTPETKYLKENCHALMRFYNLMDFLFKTHELHNKTGEQDSDAV